VQKEGTKGQSPIKIFLENWRKMECYNIEWRPSTKKDLKRISKAEVQRHDQNQI
jgi:hypothetical protein